MDEIVLWSYTHGKLLCRTWLGGKDVATSDGEEKDNRHPSLQNV